MDDVFEQTTGCLYGYFNGRSELSFDMTSLLRRYPSANLLTDKLIAAEMRGVSSPFTSMFDNHVARDKHSGKVLSVYKSRLLKEVAGIISTATEHAADFYPEGILPEPLIAALVLTAMGDTIATAASDSKLMHELGRLVLENTTIQQSIILHASIGDFISLYQRTQISMDDDTAGFMPLSVGSGYDVNDAHFFCMMWLQYNLDKSLKLVTANPLPFVAEKYTPYESPHSVTMAMFCLKLGQAIDWGESRLAADISRKTFALNAIHTRQVANLRPVSTNDSAESAVLHP